MKTLQFGEFTNLSLNDRITWRGIVEQDSIIFYGDMLNRKRKITKIPVR